MNTPQRNITSTAGSSEAASPAVVPVLWTEDEAAASLAVSRRTFQSLRTQAWMPPPIVLGPRLLRWSADELRAAVANMPRQTERVQPESLLRSKIERMKATGASA
jgi:predicted DNA-binding transcriptional regulator AlpA